MEKNTQFNESMAFNNRENACVTIQETGKKTWLSRSVAVVGLIEIDNKFLMVKRGPKCPDEVGKWVLPCGYLDWDENLTEGMYRETAEETGINLLNVRKHALFLANAGQAFIWSDSFGDDEDELMGEGTPVFVRSNPKRDAKQNVSMYMSFSVGSSTEYQFPTPIPNLDAVDPGEVADVKWMDMREIAQIESHGLIGFGHADQMRRFLNMK